MRICHLSLGLATGGLERLLVEFVRHHDRSRYELHVASLSTLGPPADDIRRAGGAVHVLPDRQGRKIAQLALLTGFLRDLRPDVLHTHNAYAHLYGSVAARLAGVPAVVHTRHGIALTGGFLERYLFRLSCLLSRAVVSVSEETRDLSLAQGCPAPRCHRIWNGVDTTVFHPTDTPTRSAIISVGRLEPVKDLPTLLQAFAEVRAAHPDAELLVVGDGTLRASLEELRTSLGLSSAVSFLGEQSDIPQLLRRATVFVNSSRSEGVALAVLEAMASGLAVVATEVGGNREVVEKGVTGLLVPPGDPAALAHALKAVLSDTTRRVAMGAAARNRIVALFDVRRMVADYERLYQPRSSPSMAAS